jgi:hypothetical protein
MINTLLQVKYYYTCLHIFKYSFYREKEMIKTFIRFNLIFLGSLITLQAIACKKEKPRIILTIVDPQLIHANRFQGLICDARGMEQVSHQRLPKPKVKPAKPKKEKIKVTDELFHLASTIEQTKKETKVKVEEESYSYGEDDGILSAPDLKKSRAFKRVRQSYAKYGVLSKRRNTISTVTLNGSSNQTQRYTQAVYKQLARQGVLPKATLAGTHSDDTDEKAHS